MLMHAEPTDLVLTTVHDEDVLYSVRIHADWALKAFDT
jgi:hypothetical protein